MLMKPVALPPGAGKALHETGAERIGHGAEHHRMARVSRRTAAAATVVVT
jgi:hypothetical protein